MPKRKTRAEDDDDNEGRDIGVQSVHDTSTVSTRSTRTQTAQKAARAGTGKATTSPENESNKQKPSNKNDTAKTTKSGNGDDPVKGKKKVSYPLSPPDPPLPTPSLSDPSLNYRYEIARGEIGVLSFEPYKSLILPYWAFRTVPVARNSAETLFAIFHAYVDRKDLVGADMTRKYIQMGMTRAKRYANYKGGKKYDVDGKKKEKWGSTKKEEEEEEDAEDVRKRNEKLQASEIFKGFWRKCIEDQKYSDLKETWTGEKKAYLKSHPG